MILLDSATRNASLNQSANSAATPSLQADPSAERRCDQVYSYLIPYLQLFEVRRDLREKEVLD